MKQGDKPWQKAVSLGAWERLESYAHNIIEVVCGTLIVNYFFLNAMLKRFLQI